MAELPEGDPKDRVRAYHQRTKHGFGAYAKGPGGMDWATQPDPFRHYEGAELLPLPLAADRHPVAWADLFRSGAVAPQPPGPETVGVLLELAFGLSAWKGWEGDRWALRCNPSSGNLHPTEAYVVAGEGAGIAPGVWHYVSYEHALEHRSAAPLPFRGLLVGLASIHWREAWKYGERAFRYCQHDVGHALAALRYAAGVLGWRVRVLDDWSDAELAALLGLDREADRNGAEAEVPDLLCRVEWAPEPDPVADALVAAARGSPWQGRANRLSRRHLHRWPVIDEVHAAAAKSRTVPVARHLPALPALEAADCDLPAATLIRQRRSAQAFDGATAVSAERFFHMLDATLPRPDQPPFDVWPWPPRVHLVLFVHRVQGLPPGLYLFARHPDAVAGLEAAKKAEFGFEPAENAPPHLALFRLIRADTRQAAKTLSCQQDIASQSAFSLGMLAEFDGVLEAEGAWAYRRLFWETGLIGQALYLEAEAAGVRGTGIGCFFDDPVHDVLGLEGSRFQSLYHFTVGGPLVDDRLETLPPYGHLQGR